MFVTLTVGDFILVAYDSFPLHTESTDTNKVKLWANRPTNYVLLFTDTATNDTATITVATEMEQVKLVAAWLMSDEDNIGQLEEHRERLRRELPKREGRSVFMP